MMIRRHLIDFLDGMNKEVWGMTANRKSGTNEFKQGQEQLRSIKRALHAGESNFTQYINGKRAIKHRMGIYDMEAIRDSKRNR